MQFYETLADLDANKPAQTDKEANYIKVTTGSWQVAPTFLVAVGGISNNATHATAVAEIGHCHVRARVNDVVQSV